MLTVALLGATVTLFEPGFDSTTLKVRLPEKGVLVSRTVKLFGLESFGAHVSVPPAAV